MLDRQSGEPVIKIVTRASTPEEIQDFQHPRMPVLEAPLYPYVEILDKPDVPELF